MTDAAETRTIATRRLADFTADRRMLVLSGFALVIGTMGAFVALILVKLILLVTNLVWFGRISAAVTSYESVPRNLWMVAAPALGGLVVGIMARYGSDKIRGHGIPEAIETIVVGSSRIGPKVALLKPLSAAIAIGTGGPFGAEGPIIMTGGAIGSLFAQFFRLSAAERKTLLVAGAAAGMTGIFGTPIAGVMLAVELLLFEWKPRSFIPVTVAATVAIAWRPLLFGAGPLFTMPMVPPIAWAGLLAALVIGLLAGLLSSALTQLLYKIEDLFAELPIHWMWWPALGGLVVGLGGLVEPRALGVGYDVIAALLNDRMALKAVALVFVVKALIWLVSLSSGTSGGVLAPLLIIGGAFGWLCGQVLPGDPGFWSLVGMSATLGGTISAPLTAAIFAFEVTSNVHALPVLLCATVAAYAVTVLLLKRSILTEKIARRGQHITREYTIDLFELTRAREIMVGDVETMPSDLPIGEAVARFMAPGNKHLAYPVVDEARRLVGVATRANALVWQTDAAAETATLGELISDASTPVVFPDDVVGRILDLMIAEDAGLVPVVDPKTRELRGIVTRKDVLSVRRAAGLAETERVRFYSRRLYAGARH